MSSYISIHFTLIAARNGKVISASPHPIGEEIDNSDDELIGIFDDDDDEKPRPSESEDDEDIDEDVVVSATWHIHLHKDSLCTLGSSMDGGE
jgi:hypothetical protein